MSEPMSQGIPLSNPPVNLLVWHTPQEDRRLEIADRTAEDPRTAPVPGQVRYVWQGEAKEGQRVHFTKVLLPHAPSDPRPAGNHPGAQADRSENPADGIDTLADSPGLTVLRFRLEPNRTELVVINPAGQLLTAGPIQTDAIWVYIDFRDGKVDRLCARQVKWLQLNNQTLIDQDKCGDVDR
jgi:hypothetical protein